MSDYQEEIEKIRLYVERLGKPLQVTPRQKRTFTPYSKRIKKMNIVLNTEKSNELWLLEHIEAEEDYSNLIKRLLKQHYGVTQK